MIPEIPPTHEVSDEHFLPISALNDLLFCERRCAFHLLEQVWEDNVHTVMGTLGHQRAHRPAGLTAAGTNEMRGLWLKSQTLRLIGKADVVEYRMVPEGHEVPYPIEYKRGRRRRWDNDDVQLCAQAMCLEEMLGSTVPAGAIYHIRSKRRREILFTPQLRSKTARAATRLHELIDRRSTPLPVPKPRCRGCSLQEWCLPELVPQKTQLQAYQRQLYRLE